MISGFGGGSSSYQHSSFHTSHGHDLPIPFNIPKVLYNLLFEDNGIEFDKKQKDFLEVLRFSYNSLLDLQIKYAQKEEQLKAKILEQPDNLDLKQKLEDMILDRQQAHYDFKNYVTLMSDMMSREQFAKLLKFSNIAV